MTDKIYTVGYTNANTIPITIPRRIFIEDIVDITLIGKRTLEYGEALNENLLHLMEHFACKSSDGNLSTPDPDKRLSYVLNNPVVGQLWYSITTSCVNVWSGSSWKSLTGLNDVSSNSGFVFDGSAIPIPLDKTGVQHAFESCSINISPVHMGDNIESFICEVSPIGIVTCKYTPVGGVQQSGYVSYIIVCSGACRIPPAPTPSPTVTITPTVTPTVTPTITPTPSYIPVYLAPENDRTEICNDNISLTATLIGSVDTHTTQWEQIDGSNETLVLVVSNGGLTASYISSQDHTVRFWIDRNTPFEQYEDFAVNSTPTAKTNAISGAIPSTFSNGNRYYGGASMANQYTSEATELLAYPSREDSEASFDESQWTLYWASPADLSLIVGYRIEKYNPTTRGWEFVVSLAKNVTKYREIADNSLVRLVTIIADPLTVSRSVPSTFELVSDIKHLYDTNLQPHVHAVSSTYGVSSGALYSNTVNTLWNLNIPSLHTEEYETMVYGVSSGALYSNTLNTLWNVNIPTLQTQQYETVVSSIASGALYSNTLNTLWNVNIPTSVSIGGG